MTYLVPPVTMPTAARMPASAGSGDEVERGAGPGHAGGDLGFVFAVPGDDERDALGERLLPGAAAAV
jgi:hypothetical protein